jgi:hypothetical protein
MVIALALRPVTMNVNDRAMKLGFAVLQVRIHDASHTLSRSV